MNDNLPLFNVKCMIKKYKIIALPTNLVNNLYNKINYLHTYIYL